MFIGARRDRDRDRLLIFFVGVVLFGAAAAVNFPADLLVAAAPVVVQAGHTTISGFASHASRHVVHVGHTTISGFAALTPRRIVGQWGGAGGAVCEDHRPVAGGALSLAACEEKNLLSDLFRQ